MDEAAAASIALNCRDAGLRDFFLEPSLDRALVAVVGLDDRFRFDLDEEVERP